MKRPLAQKAYDDLEDQSCKRHDTIVTTPSITDETEEFPHNAEDICHPESILEKISRTNQSLLFKSLTDDTIGIIFFGGYLNSLEIVNVTSCICNVTMELAKTHVKLLDLRKCGVLSNPSLSLLPRRFTSLTELNLGYCTNISDISHLRLLSNLKVLNLSGTSVCDAGIREFLLSASNLEELDLSVIHSAQANLITQETTISLSENCSKLRSLKLAWCRGITDIAVSHLLRLRCLTELDVQLTSITSSACEILSNFPALSKLNISACNVGEFGLHHLISESSGTNLAVLELRFNTELSESSLIRLVTHAPKLEALNLQYCDLTPNIFRCVVFPLRRKGVIVTVDQRIPEV